jgi:hypothetical protein
MSLKKLGTDSVKSQPQCLLQFFGTVPILALWESDPGSMGIRSGRGNLTTLPTGTATSRLVSASRSYLCTALHCAALSW